MFRGCFSQLWYCECRKDSLVASAFDRSYKGKSEDYAKIAKYLCEVCIECYGVEYCLISDVEELREYAKELV